MPWPLASWRGFASQAPQRHEDAGVTDAAVLASLVPVPTSLVAAIGWQWGGRCPRGSRRYEKQPPSPVNTLLHVLVLWSQTPI